MSAAIVAPLAHLGHVLIDLPVFMGPVVLLTLWLVISSRRGRRKTDRSGASQKREPSVSS